MFNSTNSYCDLSTEQKNQRIQEKITTLNILANLQSDSSSSSSDDDPIVDDTNQDEPSHFDYHQYIIVWALMTIWHVRPVIFLSLSLSLSVFFECFYSICFFFLRSFTPYTCVNNTVLVVIFYSLLLLRVLNIWSFLCNKKKIIQRLKFQSFKST